MGFMTLADMTDELRTVGSGAGHSLTRLKRYVNAGYFEVAALEDFRQLRDVVTIPLVLDTPNYALPSNFLTERAVRNATTARRLVWEPDDSFARFDRTINGIPSKYTIASELLIFPMPNADVDGEDLILAYSKEPTPLVSSTDLTVIPGSYDMAVIAFAKYFYLENLGESNRARNWWIRGNGMMSSQRGYLRRRGDRVSTPARFITDENQLHDSPI